MQNQAKQISSSRLLSPSLGARAYTTAVLIVDVSIIPTTVLTAELTIIHFIKNKGVFVTVPVSTGHGTNGRYYLYL